ncbi:MAG: galactose-1-phosphate uridylyltransferase [Candidatus Riflebacteria bacterium]|nr:galactose-1-phosphate uridylyltransferase [Candidatus Riflebacteria bacterium]
MSELRWNPLIGEWLATATHRQDRTFLPPADFCPLCPTKPGKFETEIPESDFDIAVFENRFPSLRCPPPEPVIGCGELYRVKPGEGVCEVVVYTSNHGSSLSAEPVTRLHKLIRVWTDRFAELERHKCIDYVYIFENKGEVIGVTLHHPHGQIYGYPFIPTLIQRELTQSKSHFDQQNRCLICDILQAEFSDGRRIVAQNNSFAAYIPFFARYPYEVHITAKRHLQALTDFTEKERIDLAILMKSVLQGFDKLFGVSFPYIMAIHQRPTDGKDHDYYHFHIEFYPPLRSAKKIKYLAGSEAGAGMFINDTLAEEKAAELKEKIEIVTWP